MKNGRHLEMRNIFSFLDDPFSMSISQLKEKLLPATDPKHHWFWRVFGEKRISLRDLIGGALQHFMNCKVLQQFWEDGILQREDTMIMQHILHNPRLDEWVRMISKGLYDHLQIYDMGQQAWLRWFPLGDFFHFPKAPISLIHALKNTYEMKKEA